MAIQNFFKENSCYKLALIVLVFFFFLNYFICHNKINQDGYEFVYIIYAVIFSGIFICTSLLLTHTFSIQIPFTCGYIKKQTTLEYENITKETTEKEKEKLFTTADFQKMLQEKGADESKWNWQLKDRIRGRRNIISDDELENIDVSEDEI